MMLSHLLSFRRGLKWIIVVAGCGLISPNLNAQLVECQQVDSGGNISVAGGCIERTLSDQIGPGQGDVTIFGSSAYLIKRDPARAIRRGRQLFQRKFSIDEGNGPRVNSSSFGDITQNRALGAGLADSCAACHGRPRGSAGFGGDVNTFPDSRDSPHLFGLGLVEMLGDEMTTDLRAIRRQALKDAVHGRPGETLVNADFNTSTDGFHFSTDTFRDTKNPAYSTGDRTFSGLDGVLRVTLGGLDNAQIQGMSGGWSRTVELIEATEAILSFRFNLVQQPNYESDEFSEALVSVGGTLYELAIIHGNGNGGGIRQTGLTEVELPLHLPAGTHTLTFGGFNSQKTFHDESTEIFFNNVKLITPEILPGPVTRELVTKGIHFGEITALPNGTVDTSEVEGVDSDLRIKPFFAQGGTISMREFLIGAFNAEMGIQAVDPVLCAATDPDSPQMATSISGFVYDPNLDTFERPPACSTADDPDHDGVTNELDAALVDFMEFYLLNYFKPGQYLVTQRAKDGLRLMNDIGCTSCHVQNLTVERDRRVADVETRFDETKGIFNELFAQASTLFEIVPDGDTYPQILPKEDSFVVRNIFSDLKRHDLGPNFDERDFDGSRLREHITEPLWGVGSTAPYGHDGRSINLDSVIRRHGGEAADVTLDYAALSENDQRKILEFLETLVLFPPDDTASSLKPGNPDADDPQDPDNHGSINLGALFQIPNSVIGPE